MKKFNYYFDYSPEVYNYIMSSKILRQSEKNILNDILDGKTVKELAIDYKCSAITICRRRKKIFDLLKCFNDYEPSMGSAKDFYESHKESKKAKVIVDEEFKVINTNTELYKIYLLTFPNGKVYVGITSQNEKDRWKNGNGYIENEIMYNDILKYGWVNIKKDILYKDLLFDEAREKEKELIILYKSHLKKHGYNKEF